MSSFEPLGKILIIVGSLIIIAGVAMIFWQKIPFLGKLPGDIFVNKGNFQFFFPIVTCLVLSVVLTLVINLVIRWLGK
jgi:hypothetical protein